MIYKRLHSENIKVNVHYKPIYLFQLYKNLGFKKGLHVLYQKMYMKEYSVFHYIMN